MCVIYIKLYPVTLITFIQQMTVGNHLNWLNFTSGLSLHNKNSIYS